MKFCKDPVKFQKRLIIAVLLFCAAVLLGGRFFI